MTSTVRGLDTASEEEFLSSLYSGGELLAAGRLVEARDHLEKAQRMQPRHEKALNLLGLTYFKLGFFDRASEIYEALVKENPADPTLRVNLGLVYLKANNLVRSVKEFEAATDLDPEHKKAHNYLGLALAQAGDYARARVHFVSAGSDAMAEKMARAMAAQPQAAPPAPMPAQVEVAPLPQRAPAPPPPPERVAPPPLPPPLPHRAPPPPPPPPPQDVIEVMSDEESSSDNGIPVEIAIDSPEAQAESPLANDWSSQLAAPRPALASPPVEERRFAEDEGLRSPPAPAAEAQGFGSREEPPGVAAAVAPLLEATAELLPVIDATADAELGVVQAEVVVEPPPSPAQLAPPMPPTAGATWDAQSGTWVQAQAQWEQDAGPPAAHRDLSDPYDDGTVYPPVQPESAPQDGGQRGVPQQPPQDYDQQDVSQPPPQDYGQQDVSQPPPQDYDQQDVSQPPPHEYDQQDVSQQPPQDYGQQDVSQQAPQDYGQEGALAADVPAGAVETAQEAGAPLQEPEWLAQPLTSVRLGDEPPTAEPERQDNAYFATSVEEISPPPTAPRPVPVPVSVAVGEPQGEFEEYQAPAPAAAAPIEAAPVPVPVAAPAPRAASAPPAEVLAARGYSAMGAPRLTDLGASTQWVSEPSAGPFLISPDGLAVSVSGEMLTRMTGLVAIVGGVEVTPELRRNRGRATEQPFGTGELQLQRVRGNGVLYLEPGKARFHAFDLDDEGAYIREEQVFAFEEPIAFENGRLSTEQGHILDLVHLRGHGRVLLQLDGNLKAMPVPAGSPMVVPLARVVGWFGHVNPRLMAFAGQAAVELTGEGYALLGAAPERR